VGTPDEIIVPRVDEREKARDDGRREFEPATPEIATSSPHDEFVSSLVGSRNEPIHTFMIRDFRPVLSRDVENYLNEATTLFRAVDQVKGTQTIKGFHGLTE